MTTTVAPTQDGLLPDERTAEPFHLNRWMLRELGSCGQYIRKHRELFPPTEYPDGPAINSATCRRYANDFDWNWALDTMLTWQGRVEVERVCSSRADRYRALGPGRTTGNVKRYAAVFGYVFATRPDLRNQAIDNLRERAEQNAELRAREELQEAEQTLVHATAEIEAWTQRRAEVEAELPALRAAVEQVQVRAAERAAARKERELAAARERLATLEREAAELRERAQAVAAETAVKTATPEEES